jgi:hypothetical protein
MLIPLIFGLVGAMTGRNDSPRDPGCEARRQARRKRRGR